MMAAVEKGGGDGTADEEEEEQSVLDFDMLCSMVAMQAQKGGWAKLKLNGNKEDEEEKNLVSESGGGVFRMWEGDLVYDCFHHPQLALHSTWYLYIYISCFLLSLNSNSQQFPLLTIQRALLINCTLQLSML